MAKAAVLGALVASALALLIAVPATACNNPTATLGKHEAAPGEDVPLTITNLLDGATYTVVVDHTEVGGGTAHGGNVTASNVETSFRMPARSAGSEGVDVQVNFDHSSADDASGPVDMAGGSHVSYLSTPAAPGAGSPGGGAGSVDSSPGETTLAGSGNVAGQPGSAPGSGPAGGAGPHRGANPATGGPRGGNGHTGGTAHQSAGQAGGRWNASGTRTQAQAQAAVPLSDASASRATARTGKAAARVTGEAAGAALPVHAWGSARLPVSGGLSPSVLIVSAGLLLVGFVGGGYAFVRLRSGRPRPWIPPAVAAEARARDLLIEAELQEIVAEHRALVELGEAEPTGEGDPELAPETVGAPS